MQAFAHARRLCRDLYVDAIEQVVELSVTQLDARHARTRRVWDAERTLVEALVEKAHAAAIEEQDFESGLSFAHEHEQRPASRRAPHLVLRQAGKAIETPA
jgi:hypothetical protein